jgi:hypothetical protein
LPQSQSILGPKVFGRDIELEDIDGDGHGDIVVTTNEGLKVFLTREDHRWEDVSMNLPRPKIGNSLMAVATGRFTDAERPQVAVCMLPDPTEAIEKVNSIGVYAWRGGEQGWEQIDRGLPRDEAYRDLRATDLNRDGKLDLLVMSIESGGVIFLGDGQGGFEGKGRLPGIHGKGRLALGDINADGWTDIVVGVPATKSHPEAGGPRAFLNGPAVWQ